MAKGIFIGLTTVELAAIRTSAVAAITAGKVRVSISADGVNSGYTIPPGMSPTEILEEYRYALAYNNGTGTRRVVSSFRCQ